MQPPGSSMDERVLAACGVLVAMIFTIVATVIAVFLIPLHIGSVQVPLCLGITLIANVVAVRYAVWVTGWRVAALGPMLAWLGTVVVLSWPTSIGDVVMPGTWVSTTLLLIGAAALVGASVFDVAKQMDASFGGSIPGRSL